MCVCIVGSGHPVCSLCIAVMRFITVPSGATMNVESIVGILLRHICNVMCCSCCQSGTHTAEWIVLHNFVKFIEVKVLS